MEQRDPADPHNLASPDEEHLQTVQFGVDGMSCEKCVESVERALLNREGVTQAKANLSEALVTVTFDGRRVDAAAIHELILSTGYKPAGMTGEVRSF